MRALVTGANGLIGANLLRELLLAGHDVTGLVRPSGNLAHIAHLPLRIVHGDVLDPTSLRAAAAHCDVVFHTAVQFSYSSDAAATLTKTATEGTRNILHAARDAGVARVVLTSSSVTLGAGTRPVARGPGDTSATPVEDDPAEPAYIRAKIAQERQAITTARTLGIELVIACPTMSVGPFGASLGPSNGVITSYLTDPLHLTWAGGCNIVSVRDVARGHMLLAEHGMAGERVILGSENLHWREIHGMIAELAGVGRPGPAASATACYWLALAEEAKAALTGRPPLATRAQARMVGRYYWYDHSRAAALGYQPMPARAALATALGWLAQTPHVSRETRAGMRLHRSVHAARAARAADERRLAAAPVAA